MAGHAPESPAEALERAARGLGEELGGDIWPRKAKNPAQAIWGALESPWPGSGRYRPKGLWPQGLFLALSPPDHGLIRIRDFDNLFFA
jgi:hypothetical protein